MTIEEVFIIPEETLYRSKDGLIINRGSRYGEMARVPIITIRNKQKKTLITVDAGQCIVWEISEEKTNGQDEVK